MTDPPISATTVSAAFFWITSFLVAGWYCAVGTRGAGVFAILLMGGGATLTVRRFLLRLGDELLQREHDAFRLGQESQRIRPVD